VAALLACALVALAPAVADANSEITVTPALPTNVSVGDTNVPGTLTITNINTGGDTSSTICEPGDAAPCPADTPGITLLPSCSSMDFSQNCLLSGANPGVFSIHGATGAASTACAGKTFSVVVVDATFGKLRFVPSGGHVVLPNPGASCRIDFLVDVLALPADGNGATGYQTLQRAEALAYSNLNTLTYDPGTQTPVNVTLAAPTLTDTDPDSPANDNAPEIKGTAPAGTTQVRLYTDASCSGSIIGQGTAATFASPGLTVPVNDNTSPTFYATVVDNLGGISDCSSGITYLEDSTPPATPTVGDSDPDSPANNNGPRIKGTADAASTVKLYTNATCTSAVAAQGSGTSFVSPGLLVAVANDTTTTFYATATDAAGNVSGCSAAPVTYVEDSTPPPAPSPSGTEPMSPSNDNTPRIQGTAAAGSTVTLYTSPTCSNTAAGQGSAAAFASSGIEVTVLDNTSTVFYSTATDAAGNVSPCSAGTLYVEDSIAPTGAILGGSSPASPANQNAPRITGTAPADTTVKLYTDAACTSAVAGEGSAATFASPGIAVNVADNATTTFYARSFDVAGNASPCSASAVTYVEDSTEPQTTIDAGPSGTGASPTPTFTFSSTDPGVTFECRIDSGEFTPCASPYTTATLSAGAHAFEVRSKDRAGNVDATSATRTFTVGDGTTPPPPPPPVVPPPPPPPPPVIKRAQPGCAGIVGRVFVGTKSNNVRNGTNAIDIMFGQSGNDSLRGAGGADCLYGEEGNDLLRGGSGADRLFGGTGKDRIEGLSGNDTLSGSFGNDRLNGGTGNDRVTAGAGNDNLIDRRGSDRFSGGSGKDVIDSRDSTASDRRKRDRILCGPGKDRVLADPADIVAKDCEKSGVIRRSLRATAAR
jgi:Ca2+-binding RTX toxin-like protein